MEEKKETKYLDLSASCTVSVTEMLQRFFTPMQMQDHAPDDKEVQDDDNG
jgi:hypothetical protein